MMRVSLLITFSLLTAALAPLCGFAQREQKPSSPFRIYASSGKAATLEEIVNAMGQSEVIFIGETHTDPVAHQIELQLLESAAARYGLRAGGGGAREVVLSMEMFERDVQTALDEYLTGLILERQLLSDTRPWNNYQSDYRPLIEFARSNKLAVLAANAPARYANMVARSGRSSLAGLSAQARSWLAPLPYGEAGAAYAAKFNNVMGSMGGGHGAGGMKNVLDAQVLRDATMAYAIYESLKARKRPLVLHVTGLFHVEGGLGVPEHLKSYRPQTRMLVVAVVASASVTKLDAESLSRIGDFVVLSESSRP